MSENLNKIYQQIIHDLSNGARALPKYTEENIKNIINEFQNISFSTLSKPDIENRLTQIFCILSNTSTTSHLFEPVLKESLEIINKNKLDDSIYVLFLSAIQKQIIDHGAKTGNRIPEWIEKKLIELLQHKNPEILEWTLRTIEMLGIQNLKYRTEINKLRPKLIKILNRHQRNAFEIIELLNRQWNRALNEKR